MIIGRDHQKRNQLFKLDININELLFCDHLRNLNLYFTEREIFLENSKKLSLTTCHVTRLTELV